MRLTPEQRGLVRAVQKSDERGFVELARVAKLDPTVDFIGANLRGIDFGTDDLAGFNFSRADLRGADLLRARGLSDVVWDDANLDGVRGWPLPTGFSLGAMSVQTSKDAAMNDHPMGFGLRADGSGKISLYTELAGQIEGLLSGEVDSVANLANAAAAIYHTLPTLNWAGFYLARGKELVLGPFQGRPACVRIPIGKGVCGAAALRRESILVLDVHEFPGHIACDASSRSELVVPLIRANTLIGVLDLDSPVPSRFDMHDQAGCEALVAVILRHLGSLLPV